MWKHSGNRYNNYNISDKIIKHDGVFSIHCKRNRKLENNEYIMMTIEKGFPCIGFCTENYSPELFTYDNSFDETIVGITYLHLDNRYKRAFTHNSICNPQQEKNFMLWQKEENLINYPYVIYMRIYKDQAQIRYDDSEWINFGYSKLIEQSYYPYIFTSLYDYISNFTIIREKQKKSAGFLNKN